MKEYCLMNKDKTVIKFGVNKTVLGVQYVPLSTVLSPLPYLFTSLDTWLQSRYVISYRTNITDYFSSIGLNDVSDLIDITHCVSITDSFWVKCAGSNLKWRNVNPYDNPLNKFMSEYSFTGRIKNKNIGSTSPDFSTDGNFPKCWIRRNGDLYLVKAGTSGAFNAGYEPYSEVFAYQLGSYLGMDIIEYKLGTHKGVDVSICKNMCTKDIGLSRFGSGAVDFSKVYDKSKRMTDMLLLDCLTCNVDRHLGNIGLLIDNTTQKVIRHSSIYDNNLSCMPYFVEKEQNFEEYVNSLRAKDGRTFKELYRLIESKYTKQLIRKASCFKFGKTGNKRADSRIKLLNKLLKYQISRLI